MIEKIPFILIAPFFYPMAWIAERAMKGDSKNSQAMAGFMIYLLSGVLALVVYPLLGALVVWLIIK